MSKRLQGTMLVLAVGTLAVGFGMLQGSAVGAIQVPTISSIAPVKAKAGASVLIKGAHFGGVTAVKFNGLNAVFTVDSNQKIHATVPVGATTGQISVLTATDTAKSKHTFTVVFDAPFVSCLTSGNANVPAGTEPYIGAAWFMTDQSFVKPFLKSATTTLTVNGTAVKKPSKFWDKKGTYVGVNQWQTTWGYDSGILLAKAGDTMTVVFHVVATKPFSDGLTLYKVGTELFPGPNCTLHAV